MLNKVIEAVIVGVVLYIVYIILSLVINALGGTAILVTLVGVLLLLLFVAYLLKAFGVNF